MLMLPSIIHPSTDPEQEVGFFSRIAHPFQRTHAAREDEQVDLIHIPSIEGKQNLHTDRLLFFEGRLLCFLLNLNNPNCTVTYVTSMPVSQSVVDYYLGLISRVTVDSAKERLNLLCCYDLSNDPLSIKILKRPRLLERIRQNIRPERTVLSSYVHTEAERQIAAKLKIKDAAFPVVGDWGNKLGSRQIFTQVEIPHCQGSQTLLTSPAEVIAVVVGILRSKATCVRTPFILKLNEGVAGLGNAIWEPPSIFGVIDTTLLLKAFMDGLKPFSGESPEQFIEKMGNLGVIVEEYIEKEDMAYPSAQGWVCQDGSVEIVSTHEQVLHNGLYNGCTFPADSKYRQKIQEYCTLVGEFLSLKGVRSERFGVDFLAWEEDEEEEQLIAVEVNLRDPGTTHPFMTLELIDTEGNMTTSGEFCHPDNTERCYYALDSFCHPSLATLTPDELIDIINDDHFLQYHKSKAVGTIFYMIDSIATFGTIGIMCIDETVPEAMARMARVQDILLSKCMYSDETLPEQLLPTLICE